MILLQSTIRHESASQPSPRLWRQEQHWLQLPWLSCFIKANLLLPRLPCSSLCFCPLNFSHCWQSPVLGLRKSGGGAYWQGCTVPVPDWMPYLFTRPEQPTCTIVHILALPSSVLNKKGEKQCLRHCAAEARVSGQNVKHTEREFKRNAGANNLGSVAFSKGRFTASHNCTALSPKHPPLP